MFQQLHRYIPEVQRQDTTATSNYKMQKGSVNGWPMFIKRNDVLNETNGFMENDILSIYVKVHFHTHATQLMNTDVFMMHENSRSDAIIELFNATLKCGIEYFSLLSGVFHGLLFSAEKVPVSNST